MPVRYENTYRIGNSKAYFHWDPTKALTVEEQGEFIYSVDQVSLEVAFEWYGVCGGVTICVHKVTILIDTHWNTRNAPFGFEISYSIWDSVSTNSNYGIKLRVNDASKSFVVI